MGNYSTLLFIYENISENQFTELKEFENEFDQIDKILDEISVDPPLSLVDRVIKMAKAI
jgi:hypothetical protein